ALACSSVRLYKSGMIIEDSVRVEAPAADVWQALKDPAVHAGWHPFVTAIDGAHELGERRECAVLVGGKPGRTTERCVEDEPLRRLIWAVEADTTGFSKMVTGWRAGFSLEQRDGGTVVTAVSTFTPRNVLVRAMTPMISRKFHATQRAILAGLAAR